MPNSKPNFKFEKEYAQKYKMIAGVDEVGRGSLAGPIVAAAVIFSNYGRIKKDLLRIDDSKKLSEKDRKELELVIKSNCDDYAIGEVNVSDIDRFGIGAANVIAFKRALDGLNKCNFALIDGRKFRGFDYPYLCLEKGESKSVSVAAASIIAKVYRDSLMEKIGEGLVDYDFVHNKGYASDKHCDALRKFGPTIHHRKTFLGWLNNENQSQTLF